jgi:hypothetical protein
MYSLDCSYYKFKFKTILELMSHITDSGMDPNYEITFNGNRTGEYASDLVEYYN